MDDERNVMDDKRLKRMLYSEAVLILNMESTDGPESCLCLVIARALTEVQRKLREFSGWYTGFHENNSIRIGLIAGAMRHTIDRDLFFLRCKDYEQAAIKILDSVGAYCSAQDLSIFVQGYRRLKLARLCGIVKEAPKHDDQESNLRVGG